MGDVLPARPPRRPVGGGHIWQVVTQWHQQDGAEATGVSPPIAFIVVGEEVRVHLHRVEPDDLGRSAEVGRFPVTSVDRGTWHHFRARIRAARPFVVHHDEIRRLARPDDGVGCWCAVRPTVRAEASLPWQLSCGGRPRRRSARRR